MPETKPVAVPVESRQGLPSVDEGAFEGPQLDHTED
jgi:hypothetical protein